jgi:hypothetical protein
MCWAIGIDRFHRRECEVLQRFADPEFLNVRGAQESIPTSKESIPPAYVAWRAGTSNRVVVPARQAGNRFLGSLKGVQIRSLYCHCANGHIKNLRASKEVLPNAQAGAHTVFHQVEQQRAF